MPSHNTHMHHHKRPARVGPNTTKNTILLGKLVHGVKRWPMAGCQAITALSDSKDSAAARIGVSEGYVHAAIVCYVGGFVGGGAQGRSGE